MTARGRGSFDLWPLFLHGTQGRPLARAHWQA